MWFQKIFWHPNCQAGFRGDTTSGISIPQALGKTRMSILIGFDWKYFCCPNSSHLVCSAFPLKSQVANSTHIATGQSVASGNTSMVEVRNLIALVSFGKSKPQHSQNNLQGKTLDANRYATKKTVAQGRISWTLELDWFYF